MEELLLGLDIGTSSSKGVLATADGRIVARAERPHRLSLPRPGWAEHDAELVWWADALAIFGELINAGAGQIVAVGVSGNRALSVTGRRRRPTASAGHPVRHRHEGRGRDRRAH